MFIREHSTLYNVQSLMSKFASLFRSVWILLQNFPPGFIHFILGLPFFFYSSLIFLGGCFSHPPCVLLLCITCVFLSLLYFCTMVFLILHV